MNSQDPPPKSIPSSLRLLAVLEEVASAGLPLTPTEANVRLQLPKPTIHRLFATLEEEGFLQRDIDGRGFAPGHRLRTLSGGVLSSLRIRTARLTILRNLSAAIGETCNLALPAREAMLYLERVETKWPLRIQLPIGSKVPFYCTASGKMYLSTLPKSHLKRYAENEKMTRLTPNTITDPAALLDEVAQTAAQGYGIDREEFMECMIALAVPINDQQGRLVATLSFQAPTQRFSPEDALVHLPALKNAAMQLSGLILSDS
jgi:DNA-binding IclR family transcriptional regulator